MVERDNESVTKLLLHIQHANRSLGKKPPPGASPRSIVVNFPKYETKESILTKAWKKKIIVEGRQIFFDHDFTTEVLKKRKSYSEIKKTPKDKQIRFQTPLSRIRIHWSDGPKIYNNAEDAAEKRAGDGRAARQRAHTGGTDPESFTMATRRRKAGDKPRARRTRGRRSRHGEPSER